VGQGSDPITFAEPALRAIGIRADIGLEVAFMDVSGWDTHANQGAASGQLANHLLEFGQGLAALSRDLGGAMRTSSS
jgi:uncharacterized protein (DUF1501 family)